MRAVASWTGCAWLSHTKFITDDPADRLYYLNPTLMDRFCSKKQYAHISPMRCPAASPYPSWALYHVHSSAGCRTWSVQAGSMPKLDIADEVSLG